ncbi:MAG: hypothetical protein JWM37_170 [Candidatus Saccharibacteria bacterium]|nr:hypothetical protein [Candidatus Saccharibacteria bacterium]
MDSLQNILLGHSRKREEPPEIAIIKDYAFDVFQENVQVMVREKDITITCPSAAMAGALRMHTTALRKACDTHKRLVFRIG